MYLGCDKTYMCVLQDLWYVIRVVYITVTCFSSYTLHTCYDRGGKSVFVSLCSVHGVYLQYFCLCRCDRVITTYLLHLQRKWWMTIRTRIRTFLTQQCKNANFISKKVVVEAGLTSTCSNRTVRRCLNTHHFFYLQPRKKGLLTATDLKK